MHQDEANTGAERISEHRERPMECPHGTRRFLWGVSSRNAALWAGWACPLLKDDPDHCEIVFSKTSDKWNEIAEISQLPDCKHGERRNVVTGMGQKGRWAAFMCGGGTDVPKQEQCQPWWVDARRTHSGLWHQALTPKTSAHLMDAGVL